jgi:hypothetical protein
VTDADRLVDEHEVVKVLYRYARGLDTRDWATYRSVFVDEIAVDFSEYRGRPTRLAADAWVAEVRSTFDGLDATQHLMSNPLVGLDGDHAEAQMYVQAAHLLRDDGVERWFSIAGCYHDELVRTGDGWKLSAVRLSVTGLTGDERVMRDARRRLVDRS